MEGKIILKSILFPNVFILTGYLLCFCYTLGTVLGTGSQWPYPLSLRHGASISTLSYFTNIVDTYFVAIIYVLG